MRFGSWYLETQKRLTLEGNIVISVGLFGHSGDDEVWTEGTKAFARYREIDKDIKRDALKVFEAI